MVVGVLFNLFGVFVGLLIPQGTAFGEAQPWAMLFIAVGE
jgi:hypothetical protein